MNLFINKFIIYEINNYSKNYVKWKLLNHLMCFKLKYTLISFTTSYNCIPNQKSCQQINSDQRRKITQWKLNSGKLLFCKAMKLTHHRKHQKNSSLSEEKVMEEIWSDVIKRPSWANFFCTKLPRFVLTHTLQWLWKIYKYVIQALIVSGYYSKLNQINNNFRFP